MSNTSSHGTSPQNANRKAPDQEQEHLEGATLSHANLHGADLSYANLGHANLSHLDLSESDMSYADLRYADLSHADLTCARLNGANLGHANLNDVKGPNQRWAYLAPTRHEPADSKGSDLHPPKGTVRTTTTPSATWPTGGTDLHPAGDISVSTREEWTGVYRPVWNACGYPDNSLDLGGEGG